jgi:Mg/Co/Ni transporter MgtE
MDHLKAFLKQQKRDDLADKLDDVPDEDREDLFEKIVETVADEIEE